MVSFEVVEAVLSKRLAQLGEKESGLYNYYARKIKHGTLLSEADSKAVESLRGLQREYKRVWDIGAGVGQLSLALANDGWNVVAVEHDKRRFQALAAVIGTIASSNQEIASRIEPLLGSFPKIVEGVDVSDDLVVVLGCTFSAGSNEYSRFLQALRRYRAVLIDFPRLFISTRDRYEWRRRAVSYATAYIKDVGSVDQGPNYKRYSSLTGRFISASANFFRDRFGWQPATFRYSSFPSILHVYSYWVPEQKKAGEVFLIKNR